jgi:hypothetical protein
MTFAGTNIVSQLNACPYQSISKEKLSSALILDVECLDPKTQAILSKFDMLVVGKLDVNREQGVSTRELQIRLSDYMEVGEDDEGF